MNVKQILTEDARVEQWQMLLHFSYETNIRRFYDRQGTSQPASDVLEYISGSLRQAEAYFSASYQAPLDIAPLLLYYGATNLLSGAVALTSHSKPDIKNHGLSLNKNPSKMIGDVQVTPISLQTGALGLLCAAFSPSCNLTPGAAWTVKELFASIPDLKQDSDICYSSDLGYCVPVEVVREARTVFERIRVSDFLGYPDVSQALDAVEGFNTAYLHPQFSGDRLYINLRRKLGSQEIGTRSLFGQKFLQIGHEKQGHLQTPDQTMIMLMSLYALGHLSRYYPELWNPFVRVDETGEKMVVERCLNVCARFIPNLVLNMIYGESIQFVSEVPNDADSHKQYNEEYVKHMIEQQIENSLNKRQ